MKNVAGKVALSKKADPEAWMTPSGETVHKKLGMAELMKEEWNQTRLKCFFVDVTEADERWIRIIKDIHKINIIIGNDC